MIRLVFLLLLSGIGIPMSAQNQITGKIYNSKTKELMPYVSLGIEAKATGTVSDRDGIFLLKIGDGILASDSITFSHIGYKSIKYSLSDLAEKENEIYLEPQEFEIAEIIIKAPRFRERTLGRNHAGTKLVGFTFFTRDELGISDQLSSELGTRFNVRNDCRVNSVNFYIKANQFDNVKLRLTFYSIEDGLPKDVIVNQDIIFDVKTKFTGWFNFDLKSYNVFITGHEHIAATLTLLEDEIDGERGYFILSAAVLPYHTVYRRIRAMDDWTRHDLATSFYLDVTEYRD